VKFLCEQCKAKYQIADDKIVGRTVRMKCRKCGHLIEMRAAVTESSASSPPPPTAPPAGSALSPTSASRPQPRPAPPRATPLAASLTAPRAPAPKPDRLPSALAGAFKTTVQHEEEVSAPFDMSELSPGNDWYVAINGVPVGPVRIAEIRRKASMGAVTEDSLVWQEGLDEWRPLRTFPDLAAIVREAVGGGVGGGRSSVLPPPGSSSAPPRPPSAWPMAPSAQRTAPQRVAPLTSPQASRSNVVAITSRLATAERLEEPSTFAVGVPQAAAMAAPATDTHALPAVAADPFAPPPRAAGSFAPAPSPSVPPYRQQKGPPVWILLVLLTVAAAFGITIAVAFVLRRPEPASVVVQVPVPTAAPTVAATPQGSAGSTTPASTDTPVAVAANAAPNRAPGGSQGTGRAAPAPTTAASGRMLDLHGIGSGPTIAPTDDPGSDGPKAAGQCMSQGQILQVIGLHQVAIRRSCWERSSTNKPAVNISVTLTIGNDGVPQSASASGDDPSVAKCIESDIRGWRFPAMGCSQTTSIPFKFVRQ
jgi:predicted Zn finger-like uncharacterized protein